MIDARVRRAPRAGDRVSFGSAGEIVVVEVVDTPSGVVVFGYLAGQRHWWTVAEWRDWLAENGVRT